MSRWHEFFEGENNRYSMARALSFMAWFPSTLVLLYLKTTEALGLYLTAFVLNSIGNKVADKIGAKKNAVVISESTDDSNGGGDIDGGVFAPLNKRKLGGKRKG